LHACCYFPRNFLNFLSELIPHLHYTGCINICLSPLYHYLKLSQEKSRLSHNLMVPYRSLCFLPRILSSPFLQHTVRQHCKFTVLLLYKTQYFTYHELTYYKTHHKYHRARSYTRGFNVLTFHAHCEGVCFFFFHRYE